MTIPFVDIQFPPRIALGIQRRVSWSTTTTPTRSGFESVQENWSRALHRFDASFAIRNVTDYDLVVQHFHSVRGASRKFPLQDPFDWQVGADRGVLVEVGTDGYQLAKTYGAAGDNQYVRAITRPNAVTVLRTRGMTTADITTDVDVDDATGLVDIDGGLLEEGDVLAWTGTFFVPCRYDTDELPGVIVNREAGDEGEHLVQCDAIPIREVRE